MRINNSFLKDTKRKETIRLEVTDLLDPLFRLLVVLLKLLYNVRADITVTLLIICEFLKGKGHNRFGLAQEGRESFARDQKHSKQICL